MNALLIIDVQRGMFADPSLQPHDGEATASRIAGLLHAARATGHPVIFIQHDGGPGDALDADGPGFAFHPALTPAPEEPVFTKTHCSAFQDTLLAEYLARAGIKSLTVCGMQTEFCVDTTCRAAAERGFGLTLVSDGHTTFDSPGLTAEAMIRHHNNVLAMGFDASLRTAAEIEKSFGG
jgi:nicotinamidase-related amidase